MGMKIGGSDEYNSEINVTPMVDVMLVLLIIFMIITPLLQQGVTVNIPRDLNAPEEDQYINNEKAVVVAIPNNYEFYIGKDRYSRAVLGEKIKEVMGEVIDRRLKGETEKRIVYIKSDVNVDYGTVVEAINIIRAQNVDKIGLVADKKKRVE
ncbi:MAG: biopolymer transporter ExbD [Acidobacteria bacterium]|jgi:biopolymer transport protein ExbD/biopolymer transport protein TolR|nr:MAG: biopolymer transporter ExbD [Acidobacteriota bacterium]GIU82447.1 MAG: biopolymer transport protein ExbD [Pyrinomonadaceae bacterium]